MLGKKEKKKGFGQIVTRIGECLHISKGKTDRTLYVVFFSLYV